MTVPRHSRHGRDMLLTEIERLESALRLVVGELCTCPCCGVLLDHLCERHPKVMAYALEGYSQTPAGWLVKPGEVPR